MTDKKPMPKQGDNFRLIGPVPKEVVKKLKREGAKNERATKQPKR